MYAHKYIPSIIIIHHLTFNLCTNKLKIKWSVLHNKTSCSHALKIICNLLSLAAQVYAINDMIDFICTTNDTAIVNKTKVRMIKEPK